MFIGSLWALGLMAVAWLLLQPRVQAWRRQQIGARPFPAEWREILKRRVPGVTQLPADLQLQLKRHIQVFIKEKTFSGCNGLIIDDEVRVTIAAQACLLLLNRATTRNPGYYPELHNILVYPDSFIVQRDQAEASGLIHQNQQLLSGESWSQGKVILSWQDVVNDALNSELGRNVVVHEFAHQLDQEDGSVNGIPLLVDHRFRQRWTAVFTREFATLQQLLADGQPTLLGAYAATSPAEFFAVASERFFTLPTQLAHHHGELYELLSRYYRVNPLSW